MQAKLWMPMSNSLRRDVSQFAKSTFPEIYQSSPSLFKKTVNLFNSRLRGLWVIPITISFFLLGQLINPEFIQWMHISTETARTIVDQRITNLATVFSITLVVIGWLLTNLSVRESLSFQLLFKKTYLYPIFYFISTLTGCLLICSLLRHESFINLQNIVIAGTLLIVLALILITFLFVRFINVVDAGFFYDALGTEVINEVHTLAKIEILSRRSRTEYGEKCKSFNLNDGINFNTDLTGHTGINITPFNYGPQQNQDDVDFIFGAKKKYAIIDMNLDKLAKAFELLAIHKGSYYRPLQLGANITENFCPYYIPKNITLPKKFASKIRKVFLLRTPEETKNFQNRHLNYFNERFKIDVKEGKKDNIEKGLAIYARIFDLEDKIFSTC